MGTEDATALTVMIMLRTLAVLPACSRTPLASYMTTMLKMRAIANSPLLVPRMTPSAVVNPSTCTRQRCVILQNSQHRAKVRSKL